MIITKTETHNNKTDDMDAIKKVLLSNESIHNVIVGQKKSKDGEKKWVAYVVAKEHTKYSESIEKNKTQGWAKVYDISYSNRSEDTDPEFNTDLWLSSYTGEAIPREQMKEWSNNTINRILDLKPKGEKPKRVLEIGCGSGLLLYPLLPHIEEYVGVDNAEEALKLIKSTCSERKDKEKVSLYVADALGVKNLPIGKFDTIIINSVTQYFPSVEYLISVIDGLRDCMTPSCDLFLGDIRCAAMLEAFHSETQLARLPADTTLEKLFKKINFRVTRDAETIFDPRLFHKLPVLFDFITSVDTQLRRGVFHNEMNKFRFDTIIKCNGIVKEKSPKSLQVDWLKDELTFNKLQVILNTNEFDCIEIVNIPNKRLIRSEKLISLLKKVKGKEDLVGSIREILDDEIKNVVGYEPDLFWDFKSHNYEIEVDWNSVSWNGKMSVRCIKNDSNYYIPKVDRLSITESCNRVASIKDAELLDKIIRQTNDVLGERLKIEEIYFISQNLFTTFEGTTSSV